MDASIHIKRLIPLFLICFCIGLIPSLFFVYLCVLAIGLKVFVIICIVDYFRKTAMRKNFGLIVSVVILAFIVSLVVLYFMNQYAIYGGLN
jgi:hypothetical protein